MRVIGEISFSTTDLGAAVTMLGEVRRGGAVVGTWRGMVVVMAVQGLWKEVWRRGRVGIKVGYGDMVHKGGECVRCICVCA